MHSFALSSHTKWLWGLVVLIVLVFGYLLIQYIQSPLTGHVFVSWSNEGTPEASMISLSDLSTTTLRAELDEDVSLIARVPSPNGLNSVLLAHDRSEGRRVIIAGNDAGRIVPAHGDLPEVPTWAPNSNTIAFSTLEKLTEEDTGNPDEWLVVRAVLNGDSLVVGRGYHPFPSFDDRVYALTSRGIELLSRADEEGELVIASAAPVHIATPFAVSTDGTRVAWVNPADRSLQVFEHVNGFFVPLLLRPGASFSSMAFSPDGLQLLGATQNESDTALSLVTIAREREKVLGTVSGSVTLHAWRYE